MIFFIDWISNNRIILSAVIVMCILIAFFIKTNRTRLVKMEIIILTTVIASSITLLITAGSYEKKDNLIVLPAMGVTWILIAFFTKTNKNSGQPKSIKARLVDMGDIILATVIASSITLLITAGSMEKQASINVLQEQYTIAEMSVEEGDYQEAIRILSFLTEKESMNPTFRCLYGEAFYKTGEYEKAKEEFEAALKYIHDGSMKGKYNKKIADSYYKLGGENFQRCIDYYYKAVKADNSIKNECMNSIGRAHIGLGEYESAILIYEKLVNEDSKENDYIKANIRANYASALRLNGDLNKAEEVVEEALSYDSSNAFCYYIAGMIFFDIEDYSSADMYLHHACVQSNRENELYERMYSLTQNLIKIEDDPDNAELFYMIGYDYYLLDLDEEAEKAFNKAKEIDTENAEYFFYAGSAQFYQEKYQAAIENFINAWNLDKNDKYSSWYWIAFHEEKADSNSGEDWVFLGDNYYTEELYNRAIRAYEKAIEKDDTLECHADLGRCYYYLDEYEKAIEEFDKSLKINSNTVTVWWRDLSAQYLLLEEKPDDAAVHNGMGRIWEENGAIEEAANWYRKATEIDPDNETYRENLNRCQSKSTK